MIFSPRRFEMACPSGYVDRIWTEPATRKDGARSDRESNSCAERARRVTCRRSRRSLSTSSEPGDALARQTKKAAENSKAPGKAPTFPPAIKDAAHSQCRQFWMERAFVLDNRVGSCVKMRAVVNAAARVPAEKAGRRVALPKCSPSIVFVKSRPTTAGASISSPPRQYRLNSHQFCFSSPSIERIMLGLKSRSFRPIGFQR